MAVMMMNPGHKYAAHKIKRMKLGHQLRDGEIGYDEHNRLLTPLVPEWGFGAVVQWLRAIGLEPERIAFLNVALCAVANDKYFPGLFDTCFNRHTRGLLACLAPHVVLLCGKGELEPYQAPIEAMGAKVILTWHYRPMKTVRGKRELKRVRRELDRLGC
ncbi:MAG: hypothetical protein NTY19_19535 [Planctomycetota bacterium]|nr:hypothetical protein [Planctomycetota bacterium]